MTEIEVVTSIGAPPAVCFDLALDADFHADSLASTGERVVARPAGGLLALGDEVTFEGRHLGMRRRLTARIEAFDRPRHFRDVMTRGAFRSFVHDHHFEAVGAGTRMVDRVRFAAPGGMLGVMVERAVLRRYLMRLLTERGQALKREAERRALLVPGTPHHGDER